MRPVPVTVEVLKRAHLTPFRPANFPLATPPHKWCTGAGLHFVSGSISKIQRLSALHRQARQGNPEEMNMAMQYPKLQLLIGGKWRDTVDHEPVLNPAEESVLTDLPVAAKK